MPIVFHWEVRISCTCCLLMLLRGWYIARTRYCDVTPFLRELHWLPVRQRIDYKILLFTFKTIHEKSPVYLHELTSIKKPGEYRLRSSSNGLLLEPPSFGTRDTLGDRPF